MPINQVYEAMLNHVDEAMKHDEVMKQMFHRVGAHNRFQQWGTCCLQRTCHINAYELSL